MAPFSRIRRKRGGQTSQGPAPSRGPVPAPQRASRRPQRHPTSEQLRPTRVGRDPLSAMDDVGHVMGEWEQAALRDQRRRSGRCPRHGDVRTHQLVWGGVKRTPLTTPGIVYKGKCLRCTSITQARLDLGEAVDTHDALDVMNCGFVRSQGGISRGQAGAGGGRDCQEAARPPPDEQDFMVDVSADVSVMSEISMDSSIMMHSSRNLRENSLMRIAEDSKKQAAGEERGRLNRPSSFGSGSHGSGHDCSGGVSGQGWVGSVASRGGFENVANDAEAGRGGSFGDAQLENDQGAAWAGAPQGGHRLDAGRVHFEDEEASAATPEAQSIKKGSLLEMQLREKQRANHADSHARSNIAASGDAGASASSGLRPAKENDGRGFTLLNRKMVASVCKASGIERVSNGPDTMSKSEARSLISSSCNQLLSDDRVQQLKNRLQDMGFSNKSIRMQNEIYRRHSHALSVEDFISTLLEMEDEGYHLPGRQESTEPDVQQENDSDVLSQERVRQLEDLLQCLGFNSESINRHKEVYRRYSNELEAEEFISVVLDDMAEEGCRPPSDNPAREDSTEPDGQQEDGSDMLSQERVRQLEDSLQCSGFNSESVNRHKEVYRRHAKVFKAEEFIAVVLDDMAEKGCRPPSDASNDREAQPEDPMCCDGDLIRSILDMGFEEEQVETAIRGMRQR